MVITTLEELEELAKEQREKQSQKEIKVCLGTTCLALKADELKDELSSELKNANLESSCSIKGVGCNGLCAAGALVTVTDTKTDNEIIYQKVKKSNAKEISESIKNDTVCKNLQCDTTAPFFTKQKKIVLDNAGIIDPESINDYIARDGYQALFEVLSHSHSEDVIEEIKKSGLRGRGGGGYPAGLKWETVSKVEATQKYIICNGDEGDPGAFMDRAIMEADPHKVLEGMIIAGYAVGADVGYIYVRAEYPLAVSMLKKAIKSAKRLGILGQSIAGTNFNFNIEVRLGGGAFVCGEATALITSIEGNRGHPRQKPPHLSDNGLKGEPTVLNNVETYANIAPIIRNGGDWYASIGTERSKGTKVFALTGQIVNTGLVEVPMGTTIREMIYDIGGGIPDNKNLKAIQTGGPSGGCIPPEYLDIPLEYESLKEIGSIMGSGGMIVMDESSSMVEVARFFVDFCKSESCGKCVPCRVGTVQMEKILTKFVKKEATKHDLEMLKELCSVVKDTSLCGLGQTAPNPVKSTLKYFENEYLEGMQK